MKLKTIKSFERVNKTEFINFIIIFIVVCITAYLLAVNSYAEVTFVGFFSFAVSMVGICVFIYFFPYIRDKFSKQRSISTNLGRSLLIGINGERPTPIRRDLQKLIRRTKI